MIANEIKYHVESDDCTLKNRSVHTTRGYVSIGGIVPIPVICNSSLELDIAVDILTPLGDKLGELHRLANLSMAHPSQVSDIRYCAWLIDSESPVPGPYLFKHDYLVLDVGKLDLYCDSYQHSSWLWGGFVEAKNVLSAGFNTAPSQITCHAITPLDRDVYKELIVRAILSPFSFERYLKFYHLIEMRFDFDIICSLKELDDDLTGYTAIFAEFQDNSELSRLKRMMHKYVKDEGGLERALNLVSAKSRIARSIFYLNGKKGNPLDEGLFSRVIAEGFSESLFKRKPYIAQLVETAAYWIYRVRCCIAHSRIGEYVLSASEEDFVVEFAEPLLLFTIKEIQQNTRSSSTARLT